MKISELMVRIGYDGDRAERGLKNLRDDLQRAERAGGSMGRGLSTAFKGLATVGIGAAAGIGAGFVASLGYGTKIAADNEVAQQSFGVLLGSAQAADGFLKQLGDFAATTPFEFPELRDAASRLLAVGTATGDVIPLMTALGDATSAMGTGAEGIDRAVTALSQMQQKGKVTGEEMLQLAEAGIPAWDALASKLGVDVVTAQAMVSDGQVRVNDLMGAIADKAGPAFAKVDGMMAAQSTTLQGLLSTFKDTMAMKLGDAAGPVVESLKASLPGLTDTLGTLLDTLAPVITKLADQFGPTLEALMPLIGVMAPIVADLAETFADKFGPILDALAPVIGELAEQLGDLLGQGLEALLPILEQLAPPLTDMIEQMGAELIQALIDLTPELIDLAVAITPLIPLITEFATGVLAHILIPALERVVPFIADIARGVTDLADGFKRGMDRLKLAWGEFEDKLKAGVQVLREKWEDFRDKLGRGVERIKGFFTSMREKWDDAVDRVRQGVDRFIQFFTGIPGRVRDMATQFMERIRELGTSFVTWATELPGRIGRAIGNLATTLVSKGRDLIGGLVSGVQARWRDLAAWFGDMGTRVVDTVGRLGKQLVGAGRDLMNGFWNGIKAVWDQITSWIGDAASHLPGFIKDPLGIESPSRVFRLIGESVGEGMRLGLESSLGQVDGLMAGFAPKMTATMTPAAFSSSSGSASRPTSSSGGGRGGDVHIHHLTIHSKAMNGRELIDELRAYQRGNGPLPLSVTG